MRALERREKQENGFLSGHAPRQSTVTTPLLHASLPRKVKYEEPDVLVNQFDDDLTIQKNNSYSAGVGEKIQPSLDTIVLWMEANNMKNSKE